jgi:dihydropteroate synthase
VLVGTSRKTFLAKVLHDVAGDRGEPPPEARGDGTLATVVWALDAGARVVRVHDVRPAAHAVALLGALRSAA